MRYANSSFRALAVGLALCAIAPPAFPQEMIDLPTGLESVNKVVSSENLMTVASKTIDPDVLLGLAFLDRGPARTDLSAMVVKAKPDYAPIVAVLEVTMRGINDTSVALLIQADPRNALGHYLEGKLLHQADREAAALEAFRRGAACPELLFYDSITGPALFKALDVLGLKGRERLCALSWVATRVSNFNCVGIQDAIQSLVELPRFVGQDKRAEVSDMLLALAGHLYAANFDCRWFAQRALESAFHMKADLAATEKSPRMNAYAAVTQALVSVSYSWPGIEDRAKAMEWADFMPSRVLSAFESPGRVVDEPGVPEQDKADFYLAKERLSKAAQNLIDLAAADPDGIIGAYLKGLPRQPDYANGPWVANVTYVEKVMLERPEVFKASGEFGDAVDAVYEAAKNAPHNANKRRLKDIGLGLLMYEGDHGQTFPASIDVLFQEEYLKPPLEARSILTGKPYAYVAAGGKAPIKAEERTQYILLYDNPAGDSDLCDCLFADGHAGSITADALKQQLEKQSR